mmetsp:Transcript_3644/g.14628  ORF Transcript_3644/g.14628 Transcript_3644/m.14628 type:complete len:230 (+) Transcript_3644:2434-3123(+)
MAPAATTSVLNGAPTAPAEKAPRSASFSRVVASSSSSNPPPKGPSPLEPSLLHPRPARAAPASAEESHAAATTASTAASIASRVARIARAAGVTPHRSRGDGPGSTHRSPTTTAPSGRATTVSSRGSNALGSPIPGQMATTRRTDRIKSRHLASNSPPETPPFTASASVRISGLAPSPSRLANASRVAATRVASISATVAAAHTSLATAEQSSAPARPDAGRLRCATTP